MENSIYDRLVELRNRLEGEETPVIYEEDHLLLDEVLDKIELGDWKEERKIEKFKKGDTVKVVGHPFLKEGILAKIKEIIVKDFYRIEFISDEIDFLIDIKYLEKIKEDWLDFKNTDIDSNPLMSTIDKLDVEVILYNYMYQWKREFDPVEVDCKNNEDRWYIYRYYDGEWYIFNWVKNYTYDVKQNLEVYFTTEEKAEQCLKWLKKERVLY